MTRLFLISHHVHRWHNQHVPEGERVTLAHRGTGGRRTVEAAGWRSLQQVARRPASEDDCIAALEATGFEHSRAEAEVRALIDERWLVEPADDLGHFPELGPPAEPHQLARDRLRWSRDALDTHALWLYPTWLGFPVLQLPSDLIWMQMLLAEVRPRFLIETGLCRGGSAMFYASMFSLLGTGHVIAIENRVDPTVREAIAAHPLGAKITIIEGDSADPAIVARVAELIDGPGAHVIALDSDHSTAHVGAELLAYAPLVVGAGKLVVFDTSMQLADRWAEDNPHRAVRAFLSAHPEFRISPWAGAAFVTAVEDGILERLPA